MSTRSDLLARLEPDYRVEQRGSALFHIVEDHGDLLDIPVELMLDERLLDDYVARLTRQAIADGVEEALGLLRVYVEEEMESSIVAGALVVRLGLERDAGGETHWFANRPAVAPGEAYRGDPLEWRAD